ncbi:MAG: 3-phosphoshikimate 1-carboxyvinyltransferase [Candidatus Omnitrophica bacterium]|nr:3-phosphoshikimate 1-carboxyvinyltransferase [Candidatus Omnitrophota bacterium]MBU1128795.1 3-phosphoshikimate 1-carboxyvinyltransferase [Candidatus Omnitrophota bacterium]MBU1784349.1 3-phosphoshikimate 1-carboxyvinyltransferase [Candidatus Omnitrophota bacterium]MBU1851212.1 3-phosphoshikimate 1-carboxyvinyltransferase [Candidatus Omnitrophota bacterium]
MDWKIQPAKSLKGELTVPPDKSISHRAIMFGSISNGNTRINNFLRGEDCMHTLRAFRSLGIEIEVKKDMVIVSGKGLRGLRPPEGNIYLGNSGTSMRIIPGILAGQPFNSVLTGDGSLRRRPMRRVMEPLARMGVKVEPMEGGDHAPLRIYGHKGPLSPIDYVTPVASAQIKSCVLAAGLYADGVTSLREPFLSRDHTERMLEYLSAVIKKDGLTTRITGGKYLEANDINIPGDISSAAFFIVGGLLVKDSHIILRDVGLNPTRTGVVDVLRRMGGHIKILDERETLEPVGDLEVKYSVLKGTVVTADEIPLLIDEIPVIAVAAAAADGETRIMGISELKVKETDRVKSITDNLTAIGARLREEDDTLIISGGIGRFQAHRVKSFGDHRTAMSAAIASLASDDECVIVDSGCVDTSYPGFLKDLTALVAGG